MKSCWISIKIVVYKRLPLLHPNRCIVTTSRNVWQQGVLSIGTYIYFSAVLQLQVWVSKATLGKASVMFDTIRKIYRYSTWRKGSFLYYALLAWYGQISCTNFRVKMHASSTTVYKVINVNSMKCRNILFPSRNLL